MRTELSIALVVISMLHANTFGQSPLQRPTSFEDPRLTKHENLFRFHTDTIRGEGVKYFDREKRIWIQRDNEVIPAINFASLASMATISPLSMLEIFRELDGSIQVTDDYVVWENELHLADNRDYHRVSLHKAKWGGIVFGVGSKSCEEARGLENNLKEIAANGGPVVEMACQYPRENEDCTSYMIWINELTTMTFTFSWNCITRPHVLETWPKSYRLHFDMYTFDGDVVMKRDQYIPFESENGEVLVQLELGNCGDLPVLFDTGATITLLDQSLFPCLSKDLTPTGETLSLKTADGSITEASSYRYLGEVKLGGTAFEPFEVVFLEGCDNLLGETIWGQMKEFTIDTKKNKINFFK